MKGTAIIVEDKIVVEWDSYSMEPKPWREMLRLVQSLADAKFHQHPEAHWELPASPFHAAALIKTLSEQPTIFIDKGIKKLAECYYFLLEWDREGDAWDQKKMPWVRPYQQSAIAFVGALKHRAVIADDVGLGKTIEALGAIWQQTWHSNWPVNKVLVVAPANVIYKWEREILDPAQRFPWSGLWTVEVLPSKSAPNGNTQFTIVSYDIMRMRVEELISYHYDIIIFDEVHYIKNYKALRTKAAEKLAEKIPHIIGLTGTPLLNDRPIEMWPWLHMINPSGWPELWGGTGYGNRYCGGRTQYTTFLGATRLPELADRLKMTSIRRTKAEVMSELPDLSIVPVPVKVDLKDYRKVESNIRETILALSPQSKGYWIAVLDRMNYLRQAVGRAKVAAAEDWAVDFLDGNAPNVKLVIYAHHKAVVKQLQEALNSWGVLTITGDDKPADRNRAQLLFQSDAEHRVVIISAAGGVGIDLFGINGVESSNILFAELEWRPTDFQQIWGRLHRMGQENAVTAWILGAMGTIDIYIMNRVESKDYTISQILHDNNLIKGILEGWR
jgi:SWI/SNF-related matrix-associated actin-dependent regulator 1 of chromatin subfamily A